MNLEGKTGKTYEDFELEFDANTVRKLESGYTLGLFKKNRL